MKLKLHNHTCPPKYVGNTFFIPSQSALHQMYESEQTCELKLDWLVEANSHKMVHLVLNAQALVVVFLLCAAAFINLLLLSVVVSCPGTISVIYLIALVTLKAVRLGFHLEFHWFDPSQFYVPGKPPADLNASVCIFPQQFR